MKKTGIPAILAALLMAALWTPAATAKTDHPHTVTVTPLGSHDGEFCRSDRAMLFEDPDGTRILYDPGRTVRGPGDPRLGRIDGVLLSHVHSDHLGDAYPAAANAGTCALPDASVDAAPESNTVMIVVAKKAKLLVGGEMNNWLATKVKAAGGDPKLVELVRFGGVRKLGGVQVYSVPAAHSDGISPEFLQGDLARLLQENGLTAYVGPPGGYVLRFSNGLVIYLSGDTGMIAEQETVIRRYFHARLVVMNIGGVYSTGPKEAAWVINELVRPRGVIPSHANEEATRNGKVVAGSKTAEFIRDTRVPVYPPLSGVTMQFDGDGKCVGGCEQ